MTYQVGYLWDIIKNIESVKLPALNTAVRLIDKKLTEIQQTPLEKEVKDKVDKIYQDHYKGDNTIVNQIESQMKDMQSTLDDVEKKFENVIENQNFLTNYSNFNEMKETIDRVDKNISLIGDASKLNAIMETYDTLLESLNTIGELSLDKIEGYSKENDEVSLTNYLASIESVLQTISTVLVGNSELKALKEYAKTCVSERLDNLETLSANFITKDNADSNVRTFVESYDLETIKPREEALVGVELTKATLELKTELNATHATATAEAISAYDTNTVIPRESETAETVAYTKICNYDADTIVPREAQRLEEMKTEMDRKISLFDSDTVQPRETQLIDSLRNEVDTSIDTKISNYDQLTVQPREQAISNSIDAKISSYDQLTVQPREQQISNSIDTKISNYDTNTVQPREIQLMADLEKGVGTATDTKISLYDTTIVIPREQQLIADLKSELGSSLGTSMDTSIDTKISNYDTNTIIPRENSINGSITALSTNLESFKTSVDTKINDAVTDKLDAYKQEVDQKFNLYYTQENCDLNFVSNSSLTTTLDSYVTKTQLANDHYNKTETIVEIANGTRDFYVKDKLYTKEEVDAKDTTLKNLIDEINDSYLDSVVDGKEQFGVRSIVMGTHLEVDGGAAEYVPGLYDTVYGQKVVTDGEETLEPGLVQYVSSGYTMTKDDSTIDRDGIINQLEEIQNYNPTFETAQTRQNKTCPQHNKLTETLNWLASYLVVVDNEQLHLKDLFDDMSEVVSQMETSNGAIVQTLNHVSANQINGLVGKDFPYRQSYAINPSTGTEVAITDLESIQNLDPDTEYCYIHVNDMESFATSSTDTDIAVDFVNKKLHTVHIGGVLRKNLTLMLDSNVSHSNLSVIVDCDASIKNIFCVNAVAESNPLPPIVFIYQVYLNRIGTTSLEDFRNLMINTIPDFRSEDVFHLVPMPFM